MPQTKCLLPDENLSLRALAQKTKSPDSWAWGQASKNKTEVVYLILTQDTYIKLMKNS